MEILLDGIPIFVGEVHAACCKMVPIRMLQTHLIRFDEHLGFSQSRKRKGFLDELAEPFHHIKLSNFSFFESFQDLDYILQCEACEVILFTQGESVLEAKIEKICVKCKV